MSISNQSLNILHVFIMQILVVLNLRFMMLALKLWYILNICNTHSDSIEGNKLLIIYTLNGIRYHQAISILWLIIIARSLSNLLLMNIFFWRIIICCLIVLLLWQYCHLACVLVSCWIRKWRFYLLLRS